MPEERDEDETTCAAGEGAAAPAGKPFSPYDLDEDRGASAETSRPDKAVPIGRPMSAEEYSRQKERARNEDRPSGGRHEQEDPSHRKRDG